MKNIFVFFFFVPLASLLKLTLDGWIIPLMGTPPPSL
jgi:hypothetical protein